MELLSLFEESEKDANDVSTEVEIDKNAIHNPTPL